MLTVVKNQIKISFLSVKYALIREMLNKTTFITNILFMVLNNASFIIQWVILYSLKDNVGGYTLKEVLLLWGLASGTYGVSRFFFKKAFHLSDIINTGKLDSFLVQPKNVLLSTITTDVETSALGDLLYAYIILFLYGFTIPRFILYTMFLIAGGLITTAIAIILGSLSFWFQKTDIIADTGNSMMLHFATYPDGIFKGFVKILLFSLIPVGIAIYMPVKIITEFNILYFIIVIGVTLLLITLSFIMFNTGLKKYSSSNLMIAKI
jgi:ABC-2 type transport system permease protein